MQTQGADEPVVQITTPIRQSTTGDTTPPLVNMQGSSRPGPEAGSDWDSGSQDGGSDGEELEI